MENDDNSAFHTVVVANADGKKQILHIHRDSSSQMNALFDPSEWLQPRSAPYKSRNLPNSFFNQPDSTRKSHKHFHSKSTGLLDMSSSTQHMVSNEINQPAPINKIQYNPPKANASLNSNNNNNLMQASSPPSMMKQLLSERKFTQQNNSSSMTQTHSVSRRSCFVKAKRRYSKPSHSRVIHGRSKSFPELLDISRLTSTSEDSTANMIAAGDWGNGREVESNLHGHSGYAVPFENSEFSMSKPSHWNEGNQFNSAQSFQQPHISDDIFMNYSSHGASSSHGMTSKRSDYINLKPSWTNHQTAYLHSDSASRYIEPPAPRQTNVNMTSQSHSSSFMKRLMNEKQFLQQQISKQQEQVDPPPGAPINPMAYHRRDASCDSGLGLGGLSITPDNDVTTSQQVHLDEAFYPTVGPIPVAMSNHHLGDTSHMIDQLLDSFPESTSVDAPEMTYDHFRSVNNAPPSLRPAEKPPTHPRQDASSHYDVEEPPRHHDASLVTCDQVIWL